MADYSNVLKAILVDLDAFKQYTEFRKCRALRRGPVFAVDKPEDVSFIVKSCVTDNLLAKYSGVKLQLEGAAKQQSRELFERGAPLSTLTGEPRNGHAVIRGSYIGFNHDGISELFVTGSGRRSSSRAGIHALRGAATTTRQKRPATRRCSRSPRRRRSNSSNAHQAREQRHLERGSL